MKHPHGSFNSYAAGFALSIVLTVVAYVLVVQHIASDFRMPSPAALLAAIGALAVIQLYVQVRFFLHLGAESKPRWNLMAFGFMLLVVIIVVFGSLWIMHNLNYHMMSPSELKSYLHTNEGL